MASNECAYSCEICGLAGLTEPEFRRHTRAAHVDGAGTCPFCQAAGAPAELALHVNQAHLDFLTPEADAPIGFIDEPPANINRARAPTVNGGGSGSPLRAALALPLVRGAELKARNLRSEPSELQCPICAHLGSSPGELEEHVNRRHFDLTSPSISSGSNSVEVYACPLCVKNFSTAPDLELHVNIEHRDVLSPASPSAHACPVCGILLDGSPNSDDPGWATRHVESHFLATTPPAPSRAALRAREQRDFEQLRAQYGMDNQGNFREQSVANMQRAVYAGELSVADYYERTLDLRAAESCGVDDGSSVTRAMVPRVRAISASAPTVVRTLLATAVDHYASSYGDRGWGCGYRNTQMLVSSLLTHTGHNDRLYRLWKEERPPRSAVPSIGRLQALVEAAWAQGFDVQGSEQLGCRLVNTRKWIGATEVVTLLSFLRIKCHLVDFHRPTGAGGTHPELFAWVLKYFENGVGGEFTPPLYLQHQGHSRTIMGIEVHRDGSLVLLVLDPSHSPQQMAQFGDTNSSAVALRLLRKNEAAMKAKQYQIVAVVGTIDTEQQYQQGKILRGFRIPQDR